MALRFLRNEGRGFGGSEDVYSDVRLPGYEITIDKPSDVPRTYAGIFSEEEGVSRRVEGGYEQLTRMVEDLVRERDQKIDGSWEQIRKVGKLSQVMREGAFYFIRVQDTVEGPSGDICYTDSEIQSLHMCAAYLKGRPDFLSSLPARKEETHNALVALPVTAQEGSVFQLDWRSTPETNRNIRESLESSGAVEVFSADEGEKAVREGKMAFWDRTLEDRTISDSALAEESEPGRTGLTIKWTPVYEVEEQLNAECIEFFGHVPKHSPAIAWRAEVAELPGLSIVTGLKWHFEQFQYQPWLVTSTGLPGGVQERVSTKESYVQIRGVDIDEKHPFGDEKEMREIVEKRAVEIREECRARRERERARIAEIRESNPPDRSEPEQTISLKIGEPFKTSDLVAFEGLPEEDKSQWGSRVILSYDEPEGSWCGAFMALETRDELVNLMGSNARDITPAGCVVKEGDEESRFMKRMEDKATAQPPRERSIPKVVPIEGEELIADLEAVRKFGKLSEVVRRDGTCFVRVQHEPNGYFVLLSSSDSAGVSLRNCLEYLQEHGQMYLEHLGNYDMMAKAAEQSKQETVYEEVKDDEASPESMLTSPASEPAEETAQLDAVHSTILEMDQKTLIRFQSELQFALKSHEIAGRHCTTNQTFAWDGESAARTHAFKGKFLHERCVKDIINSPLYRYAREALSKATGRQLASDWAGWACFEQDELARFVEAIELVMSGVYGDSTGLVNIYSEDKETAKQATLAEFEKTCRRVHIKGIFLKVDMLQAFEDEFVKSKPMRRKKMQDVLASIRA